MSVIIYDDCTGANGTDVNGRTPDTTNTPGNTYVSTANTWECDGSGNFKTSGAGTQYRINTGVTDMKSTVRWTNNGSANRFSMFVRSSNDAVGTAAFDGYSMDCQVDAGQFRMFKTIDNVNTQLGSTTAHAFDNTSDFVITVEVQGGALKAYIGGVLVFSASDSSVDGSTVGGTFTHLFHGVYNGTGGRVRWFEVNDLAAGGFRSRIAGGLVMSA